MLRTFLKNRSGSMAPLAALLALPLMIAAATSADYAIFANQKTQLQDAADSAALASVQELSMNGAKSEIIATVAENFARNAFGSEDQISKTQATLSVSVEPDFEKGEVTVELRYDWTPFMAHVISDKATPIVVTSTAGLAGDALTCIIGLMQPQTFAKASIHLDNESKVEANGCSVFSNSPSRFGLRADKAAAMEASTICSAGGIMAARRGIGASFTPEPITDCPKIEDPLANRAMPVVTACTSNNARISEDTTLSPGVYCGGLVLENDADVTLEPGVYTIKDGPLLVNDSAKISGNGVTFFLTGSGSIFEFASDTDIDLAAPETGLTAGILMFEDRTVPHSFSFNPFWLNNLPPDVRLHKISSNTARNLLGTIYLPNSILLIDANSRVADESAYTALIVGRLWLKEGPTLTINSNLTDTKVPVPDGLVGKEPRLVY